MIYKNKIKEYAVYQKHCHCLNSLKRPSYLVGSSKFPENDPTFNMSLLKVMLDQNMLRSNLEISRC